MEYWNGGVMEEQNGRYVEYTKRHNLNRGYMKLSVWNDAVELFKFVHHSLDKIEKLDFKLRSQIMDSAQSISANIAEGYCRTTIKEYLQYLNIALGSSGEAMTQMIGLTKVGALSDIAFEEFDKLHYSVENKLLALIKSLQAKRKAGTWDEEIRESEEPYTS